MYCTVQKSRNIQSKCAECRLQTTVS